VTFALGEGRGGALADPAFEELRQEYRRGNLVLFIGAGVSEAAGLPSWRRLVQLLTDRARACGAAPNTLAEIDGFVEAGRFIDAFTAARDIVGHQEFVAVVKHNLDDREKITGIPEIGQAIAELAPSLRAVLTTNLDGLLERALQGTWPVLHRATGNVAQEQKVILKLHGTLLDADTWVLTRDQYDRAMYNDPRLSAAVASIFHVCPILFVGNGLADDDFAQILGRVRAHSGGQPPRHFALAPERSIAPFARKICEDAGVRILEYSAPNGNQAEVPRILRWLASKNEGTSVESFVTATGAENVAPRAHVRPMLLAGAPPPDAPYNRDFYIHRLEEEERAIAKLTTPGIPVVLCGPWLSGKSTMLCYLLEQVREEDERGGKKSLVLHTDLRDLLSRTATPDELLERFARNLSNEARLEPARFESLSKGRQGWSDKLIELMEDHILPKARGRTVLVVEKADAVWGLGDVQGAFYGALRRCKERASRPAWSSLRFILLLSTTPSLVFEDPAHADSPFSNLTADAIHLEDLTPDSVVDLARMHGLTWDRAAIDRWVYPLVGGHPYLLRALMSRARHRSASLDDLANDVEALEALFESHLSALGQLLDLDPKLLEAAMCILDTPLLALDEDLYQRLRRAGLASRSANGEHKIRYKLYESYFRRRWKTKQFPR
jgi:AAA domain-containing protein/SIR2-like protein